MPPDTTAPDATNSPSPGGTTVAMPSSDGTTSPMPGPQGGGGPSPGGTTVAMPQAPPPQSAGGQLWQNLKTYDPTVGLVSGAAKEAQKHLAGAIDLINKYIIAPHDPGATATTQKVSDAAQAASDWLKRGTSEDTTLEKAGGIGESAGELVAPEAWLGKIMEGMSYTQRLAWMAENSEMFLKSPKLMKVAYATAKQGVKSAISGATTMGAQGYVESGGDTDTAKRDAEAGGAGGAIIGGVAGGWRAARQALAEAAAEVAPTVKTIFGADFPQLASEDPNASLVAKASAKASGQPDILAARQQAVPVALGNMNEQAIRKSLGRSNAAARPEIQLPTGDSNIPPATPRETLEAQLSGHQAMMNGDGFSSLDPAEQQQITDRAGQIQQQLSTMPNPAADRAALATRYKGYQKTMNADTFDALDPEMQNSIKAKADALKAQLDATPQPQTLSQPQQELQDYKALRDDPSFANRSPEFQGRINNQIKVLTNQLETGEGLFHPHDIDAAVAAGRADVGTAGQVLRDEHIPVYEAIDKENKGQFNALDQHGKDLRTAMSNVTNVEDIPKIRQAIRENDAKIDAMFEADNPTVPAAVRQQARLGYKDGSALLDLNGILEGHAYNGVTAAESANPSNILQRQFKGGEVLNRKLQNLLEDRPELGELLGPSGITNLKEIGTLLSTPSSAYEASGLLGNIGKAFRSQKNRSKSMVGAAAYGPGHLLAAGGLHGAAATAEGTNHYILQRLATDPDFNKSFSYAVRNKVPNTTAVSLLVNRLLGGEPEPPTTKDKQVVAPDASQGVQGVTLPVLTGGAK